MNLMMLKKLRQSVYCWGENMISINVYDLETEEEGSLDVFEHKEKQIINDFDEELSTLLIKNNLTANGYRNFRIVTDKVYDQTVRVRGKIARQVIIQETYQAYYKESRAANDFIGSLVTLCKAEDALKVKNILEKECKLKFKAHEFDILRIIQQAADVRNAKFNVNIETVTAISMKGTKVSDTQYYSGLLQQGKIKAVIITFDTPGQTVTFRISVEGSILLYSQLDESEILDLVEQLIAI